MTDAQEDIKSNLTLITPEIQNRKRDEEKDSGVKDQSNRRENPIMQRKDEMVKHQVLGL